MNGLGSIMLTPFGNLSASWKLVRIMLMTSLELYVLGLELFDLGLEPSILVVNDQFSLALGKKILFFFHGDRTTVIIPPSEQNASISHGLSKLCQPLVDL